MIYYRESSPDISLSLRKCSRTSTQCAQCEVELASHSELFRHLLLSHVPPEVVKTLPVYAEGESGWCQTCSAPLPLSLAEQHMAEKHPELVSQAGPLTAEVPASLSLSQAAASQASSPVRSPSKTDLSSEGSSLTEQSERQLTETTAPGVSPPCVARPD